MHVRSSSDHLPTFSKHGTGVKNDPTQWAPSMIATAHDSSMSGAYLDKIKYVGRANLVRFSACPAENVDVL